MKVWIGLSPDDVQGMEFDLTPLELRDLIGKPNWVPTKFLGWRTWKTSVYFKIIIYTDWRAGLTEENVNKAIKILNG